MPGTYKIYRMPAHTIINDIIVVAITFVRGASLEAQPKTVSFWHN